MTSILRRRRPEVAIDFGTANVRVVRRDHGIVFDEPSLCCFSAEHGARLVVAGANARLMIDRAPTNLRVERPLRRGVLQNIDAAKSLLRYALSQPAVRNGRNATRAIIGVPADATQAERGALLTAANDAGLSSVELVAESHAAALGAELPVEEPVGSMIIDCGAGITEIGVFSLGGLCETGSVRIGGNTLNRAIADYLHLHHKFLIGELTAERVKFEYAEAIASPKRAAGAIFSVRGKCLRDGLPKSLDIQGAELDKIVEKHVIQIVDVVRDVLGRVDPELSRDIWDRGAVLTGGGASMPLMRTMIADATGLEVRVADNPADSVANGLHRMLTR